MVGDGGSLCKRSLNILVLAQKLLLANNWFPKTELRQRCDMSHAFHKCTCREMHLKINQRRFLSLTQGSLSTFQ